LTRPFFGCQPALVDDKGQVTDLSENVVKDAELRMLALQPV